MSWHYGTDVELFIRTVNASCQFLLCLFCFFCVGFIIIITITSKKLILGKFFIYLLSLPGWPNS